jgi:hypothetical protein
MKVSYKAVGMGLPVLLALAGALVPSAAAQGPVPVVAPIVVDTAVPIIAKAVKPKQPAGTVKFEGFVMNANIAQITARAKGDDLSIQTFPLSEAASAKMQQIVDKGGYQYGDKVTIYYDAASKKAVKIKGKPSRPI